MSMGTRGAAPRSSTVGNMANIPLAACDSYPPPTVRENWLSNFVVRPDELSNTQLHEIRIPI